MGLTWTQVNTITSVHVCKDIVPATGGYQIMNYPCGPSTNMSEIVAENETYLLPGQVLTITFKPFDDISDVGGVPDADIIVSCTWINR
jgi:hypothetical protein